MYDEFVWINSINRLMKKYGISAEIEEIDPSKLKLDLRARWKCIFGCENYGKPSCPPNVPSYQDCVEFVRSYKKAILFRFKLKDIKEVKRAQEFMIEVEFSVKRPYAFATFLGACQICEECHGKCSKARPSLSALCIDASQFNPDKDERLAILFVE